jgi:16S rRNA (uracil1498-N3)-methyltransferase
MPFDEMLACDCSQRLWIDERPGAPAMLQVLKAGEAALAIGPEGGWPDTERESFSKSGWTGASLGPAVLRTETAVCAALAVWIQLQSK